ncbi:uncharacterized protein C1orf131 [Scaptodrosophila lebanonensis]|uniref:Uncharacterized protein C1orf131 n=1 Tax=Drosophila lebanonensis TaxID=7225 RepID=A0A6J2TXH4_DROLE|nr:uncharacterized protein C1orf131 [Scaptodrosophila lebanonensis]
MNVSTDFKPIPTRAALALQKMGQDTNTSSAFTALVFQEPKSTTKRPQKETPDAPSRKPNTAKDTPGSTQPEFDIKKARNEVLNFAMSNQRVIKNKRKMEIFKLVKLGMKPPKKEYKNYKELQAERKRLRDIREERKKFHQLGKNQTGAASVKCRSRTKLEHSKKKRMPVANIDEHYGKAQTKFKKKK